MSHAGLIENPEVVHRTSVAPMARRVVWLGLFSRVASVLTTVIGGLVLVGWFFNIRTLQSLSPGLVTMKANAAAAFVLTGTSLGLLRAGRSPTQMRYLGWACAGLAALVGFLTLSEYVFGWELGIDQLLALAAPGAVEAEASGRMAPATAVSFLLIGVALLLLDVETRDGRRPAQYLALTAGLLHLVPLVGYLYGVTERYRPTVYTTVAFHTAITFLVLCAGILCARLNRGLMSVVVGDSVGGVMFRSLLPTIIGIPLILGWLQLAGQRAGFYGLDFGTSLLVVSTIAVFALVAWRIAHSLEQTDLQRRHAEEEVRRLNAELKQRVKRRTNQLEVSNQDRQQLRTESERVAEEMRGARQIQRRLFPTGPPKLPGLEIAGAAFPASATGGDYFDYLPMPDGSWGIVIGDVSGHGLGPALLMADIRAYLHLLTETHSDVGNILKQANDALSRDTEAEHFITLAFARLDPRTRSYCYTGAGHPSAHVIDPLGKVRIVLASDHMPLGMGVDGEFHSAPEITLRPGEIVLMLTDGVTEAFNPHHDMFGISRALEVVQANHNRSAEEVVAALYQAVQSFCCGHPQQDDITVVVIKVPPDA